MRRLRPGFEFHADRLLRLLNEYAPPPRNLLEIGCATGLLLKAAKKAGYSVSGLEPASGHSDFLPPEVAASVQRRKLEDADFAEASFDVIVAIQLLEHLIDPAVFALKLRHILKPGGIAYVETPNFDCVSRRLKLDSWMDKNLIAGHWHLFDPHSISVFCERMGLRVLRCWTFFKALGIHSRSAVLGKSLLSLDYTLGRAGLGNNVAVLITRD
jgi:SAM-dependent methyltransferase